MYDHLQLHDTGQAVLDRVIDLYRTASSLRVERSQQDAGADQRTPVGRIRRGIGRRLVSLGSSLAGQAA